MPIRYATFGMALFGLSLVGLACAGKNGEAQPTTRPVTQTPACHPEKDRAAILAMAGGYDVSFSFTETVALAPDYAPKPTYDAQAKELVLVVEDRPDRVVLQHILSLGDEADAEPLKHWRQDWTYENAGVLEYRGNETWRVREIESAPTRCTWTQEVFGVEDAPRYGSWGRWRHQGGVATWTSEPTWRPLPRRERKRGDYDVIVGVNRHTITPTGWVHEQDNGKLVLRGENRLLARELGVNHYRKSPRDFSVARVYWKDTAPFWQDVRKAWAALERAGQGFRFAEDSLEVGLVRDDIDEALEEDHPAEPDSTRAQRLETVIKRHLAPGPTAGTTPPMVTR